MEIDLKIPARPPGFAFIEFDRADEAEEAGEAAGTAAGEEAEAGAPETCTSASRSRTCPTGAPGRTSRTSCARPGRSLSLTSGTPREEASWESSSSRIRTT